MPNFLTNGAPLQCTMGTFPQAFIALEFIGKPTVDGLLTAWNIETAPIVNIPSFVMCRAPTNPTVIAATAAAMGTPTPGACVPATGAASWMPPSATTKYLDMPLATVESKCACTYGGMISVLVPIAVTAQTT